MDPVTLAIPPELRLDLEEADALSEVVVLIEPTLEVLEAYTIEERLGVIAVMAGTPEAAAAALDAGALEVLDPREPALARARLATAVARFRSRLRLEEAKDALDRQTDALERDLRLAARLQRSLMPRALPEPPGARFATAYLPREFVSGDSWEVRRLDDDRWALYTLDAVGHGVRAALLTVLLRQAFRPHDGARLRPPGEVLADLDRILRDADLDESPTAAFCYGLLDLPGRRLTLANAGHPLPLRIRAGASEPEPLGSSDLLLGVQPEAFASLDVELAPGDRVFFFTDGADPAYEGRFGAALLAHRDLDLMDQVGGALGQALVLDEEGRPEDDVCVLAFELTTPGAAPAAAIRNDDTRSPGGAPGAALGSDQPHGSVQ